MASTAGDFMPPKVEQSPRGIGLLSCNAPRCPLKLAALADSFWQSLCAALGTSSSQRERSDARLPLRVLKLILAPSQRATLHGRIERRFDAMLGEGFLDEVRALRALPSLQVHPSPLELPALRAVGYRQAWEHMDGVTDADEFRDRAIFATRQLAKRQLTWLRGQLDAQWFDPAAYDARLEQAIEMFLAGPRPS